MKKTGFQQCFRFSKFLRGHRVLRSRFQIGTKKRMRGGRTPPTNPAAFGWSRIRFRYRVRDPTDYHVKPLSLNANKYYTLSRVVAAMASIVFRPGNYCQDIIRRRLCKIIFKYIP